ncbi:aldo/keto reductase [Paenibacillus sp. MWE-103]|uniref:Aldo/keto reductase n=1 Tax=Paenibacillus artemisiicola TaxID=1172618 RepID=A0ABS3WDY6_9BACL|nr:aldo/keto reductase [Paenibacillus artemisiicola]MBO7746535.1 aldo/keto reductase [Paenibacillus artemisiicola]
MRYGTIPGTDLNAAVIVMGTAGFGGGMTEAEAFRLFDLYVEQGGNFFDTALVYDDWLNQGRSLTEIRLGKWLKERGNRGRLVLATKGGHPELSSMHIGRLGRDDLIADVDRSLSQLGTDVIDLYWLHRDDPAAPIAGIMEALDGLVKAGKIRSIGCSNWTVARIEEARAYAEGNGLTPFVASQPLWNMAVVNPGSIRDTTLVIMSDADKAYFERTGMAVIPFSSQANGFFGGRYARDREAGRQGSAEAVERQYFSDANFGRLERAQRLAAELGTTGSAIALAYLTSQPFPVFPIIGATRPEYVRDSCAAGELTLTPAQVRYLETGE